MKRYHPTKALGEGTNDIVLQYFEERYEGKSTRLPLAVIKQMLNHEGAKITLNPADVPSVSPKDVAYVSSINDVAAFFQSQYKEALALSEDGKKKDAKIRRIGLLAAVIFLYEAVARAQDLDVVTYAFVQYVGQTREWM